MFILAQANAPRRQVVNATPSALDGGGWWTPRSGPLTPGKQSRYPLYRRLAGPQKPSGLVRKISPPLGFDPRNVQPDWAIAAIYVIIQFFTFHLFCVHKYLTTLSNPYGSCPCVLSAECEATVAQQLCYFSNINCMTNVRCSDNVIK